MDMDYSMYVMMDLRLKMEIKIDLFLICQSINGLFFRSQPISTGLFVAYDKFKGCWVSRYATLS